jgi:predicted nucleic acid-binding protein
MKKAFFDTNVIVYANDARDPQKQAAAIDFVAEAIRTAGGVISTQVLQEYAVVATGKLGQAPDVVLRQLRLLESLEVILVTPALIRRSLELQSRYQIDFWDASILAAAEHANCTVLLSEDLNPGQLYAGVRVENPFGAGESPPP